jgi:hypothetical protein
MPKTRVAIIMKEENKTAEANESWWPLGDSE